MNSHNGFITLLENLSDFCVILSDYKPGILKTTFTLSFKVFAQAANSIDFELSRVQLLKIGRRLTR